MIRDPPITWIFDWISPTDKQRTLFTASCDHEPHGKARMACHPLLVLESQDISLINASFKQNQTSEAASSFFFLQHPTQLTNPLSLKESKEESQTTHTHTYISSSSVPPNNQSGVHPPSLTPKRPPCAAAA